jgi:hypothetical protein
VHVFPASHKSGHTFMQWCSVRESSTAKVRKRKSTSQTEHYRLYEITYEWTKTCHVRRDTFTAPVRCRVDTERHHRKFGPLLRNHATDWPQDCSTKRVINRFHTAAVTFPFTASQQLSWESHDQRPRSWNRFAPGCAASSFLSRMFRVTKHNIANKLSTAVLQR